MNVRHGARRIGAIALATAFVTSFLTPLALAAPGGARLEFLAGGFDDEVMAIVQPPGDDRIFILERQGFITIVEPDGSVLPTPFLNVDPQARSMNGLVFHPDFQTNGLFYVYTVEDTTTLILEYAVDSNNPNLADTSTRRVVLQRPRQSDHHKGGQMEFGPEGYLWVSFGDGGPPPGDPFENGQDVTTIDGSIIRIDHVTGAGHPDNPFVGQFGDDAIWAYGFRHPYRFSFDGATGLMYVADTGDGAREEVDVIAPDQAGDNFGWDVMEGTYCFEDPEGNEAPCGDPSYVMPDYEYSHQEGCAVIGGYVYHGTRIPQLQDQYIYADYCEGWIKTFQYVGGNVTNIQDWTATLGTVPFVTTFGEDNAGELLIAVAGDIYKIVPDGPPAEIGTIAGTAWTDDDQNGIQDTGEAGRSGVGVELWVDSDTDGTADLQLDSTATSALGDYSFPDLAITATYVVRVDSPLGSIPTIRDAGGDDAVDSDADPATGFTDPITLGNGELNDTIDFGLIPAAVGTIAGRTWRDEDGDGIQDAGEPGFPATWAWLYTDDDLDGIPDTKIDAFAADPGGNYSFEVDPALTYHVLMGQQIFLEELLLVLPNRTEWSPQNQGGDDAVDSDADPATGFSGPINVADGEVNDTVDAGFVPLPNRYPDLVEADGAVAYWRLGENGGNVAVDIAGTNHGTVIGAPGWGELGFVGDTDTALRFDGATLITIPDTTDINLGGPFEQRSIEAWFVADSTSGNPQVLYEEGSTSRGLSVYIYGGNLYGGIWNRTGNGDGTTPWSDVFLSTPILAGSTHHVVFVYDFTTNAVELYLNGALAASASGVGRWFGHGGDIGIGAMNDGTRLHMGGRSAGDQLEFAGILDEVAVYPTALDGASVAEHYGGEPTNRPPSVDAGPAQTISLPSGAALDGTVNDDGLPGPLTTMWEHVGGAGTVTFGNENMVDTSATFSSVGAYTLRLTADDGDFSVSDTVIITVDPESTETYADEVLGDGPLAYWRLGESSGTTVTDAVGLVDASIRGAPTLGVPGLVSGNTAFRFDGVDDWLSVPDTVGINRGGPWEERTVELWFNADDDTSIQVLYEEGGTSRGLSMYLSGGRLYGAIWNRTPNAGDPTTPWASTVFVSEAIAAGTTHHAALVYDFASDALRLYVNGAPADSASGVGRWYAHGGDIGIGAMNGGSRFHYGGQSGGNIRAFDGVIDEVAIYPTALGAGRIAAHFNAG